MTHYPRNFIGSPRDSIDGSRDIGGPLHHTRDLFGRALDVFGAVLLLVTVAVASIVWSESGAEFTSKLYVVANIFLFISVILDRRRGGVSLLIRFFFLFIVAIPALAQVLTRVYPGWTTTFDAVELAAGYQILAVGQIALMAGTLIFDSQEHRKRVLVPFSSLDPDFFRKALVALSCIAAATLLYLGSDVVLATRYALGDASNAGGVERLELQILQLGRSITLLSMVIAIYLWRNDRASRRNPVFIIGAALTVAVFAMYFYPPALSRFMLFGAILGLSAVFVNYFNLAIKTAFGLVAPTFLFFLFPAIKIIGEGQVPDLVDAVRSDVYTGMLRADFDAFREVVDSWMYIRQGGDWRLGENFLGVALFWIPRSVWPSKPSGSGDVVAGALGYSYTNVSNPLPSEAYISFGFPGVVVVCILVGWWVARLEYRTRTSFAQNALGREVLLYAIVTAFAIIILRGAIQGVVSAFGGAFIAYWALGWIQRKTHASISAEDAGRSNLKT